MSRAEQEAVAPSYPGSLGQMGNDQFNKYLQPGTRRLQQKFSGNQGGDPEPSYMAPRNQYEMQMDKDRQSLGNNLNDKFHARKARKDAGYNLITNTLSI